jgi:hypothetical protein
MSQLAVEIARDLAVAAIQAQQTVFDQDTKSSLDATKLGHEVATLFATILNDIKDKVPKE